MVMNETMKRNRRAWRMRAMSAAAGGSTYADVLLGSYQNGLAIVARDNSMVIRDRSTFANNYSGTPGAKLTVTRASNATYWGSDGLLKTAANNVLRRDFDPRLSGACGYLVEEARTNNLTYSEDFRNTTDAGATRPTVYGGGTPTVTINDAVAPNGTTTATKISDAAGFFIYKPFATSAIAYTLSVFAKAGTVDVLQLGWYDGTDRFARFTLSGAGSIANQTSITDSAIVSCGNGWYRCSVTATSAATTSQVRSARTNAAGTIYIWGDQFEAGSFATSYIPTTTATVTRAADLPTLAGTLFPLNVSEGTLYAKTVFMGTGAAEQVVLALDDGGTNELTTLKRNTSSKMIFSVVDGGSEQLGASGLTSTASVNALAITKSAARYKLNDCAVCQAGESVATDGTATMPTPTGSVFGNRGAGSRAGNCWILEAMILPAGLSNTQLAALVA